MGRSPVLYARGPGEAFFDLRDEDLVLPAPDSDRTPPRRRCVGWRYEEAVVEETIEELNRVDSAKIRKMARKYLAGRQLAVGLVSACGVRPAGSCFQIADH